LVELTLVYVNILKNFQPEQEINFLTPIQTKNQNFMQQEQPDEVETPPPMISSSEPVAKKVES